MRSFALIIVFVLGAVTFGQDFTGLKFCLNPGHGGHDSDDRYIAATGFWESESNLTKGLYMRDILESHGAEIIMSRTLNRTQDDLPLSQIANIANQNNVDFFHSIHSNGFNGELNYPLMLFRGYDDNPVFPEAKTMSNHMFDELLATNYVVWNYGHRNVRGDWDFYPWGTQGLGVLRTLTMPGTLSEGSFHDYIPESWRLQSIEYRKHEAWALSRAFVTFYNKDPFATGIVAGVVRDPERTVSYFYLSGTDDDKRPYNYVEATLEPGGYQYTGDMMNNGFFFFDSLAPGNYTLYVSAPGTTTDTIPVTVTANQSTFADVYLLFDTTSAPEVLDHYPGSDIDSILATESLLLRFSHPMDKASTEAEFSITPAVDGSISWRENDAVLVFRPDSLFAAQTEYTVSLGTGAKSKWNVNLSSDYSFQFMTKYRSVLSLVETYPAPGEESISTTVQIRLAFDAPLYLGSVAGNIGIFPVGGAPITIKNGQIFEQDGRGYIYFEPKYPLEKNHLYRFFVRGEMHDTSGIYKYFNEQIEFRTYSMTQTQGTVIDNLESFQGWQQPDSSGGTTGINPDATEFSQSYKQHVSGSNSGMLEYEFTSTDGVCHVANDLLYNIGNTSSENFGMWVFGDNSGNVLEYWFFDDQDQRKTIIVDTLDYTGWKIQYIAIGDIGSSGDSKFDGFALRNINGAVQEGTLYIDDVQNNIMVTAVEDDDELESAVPDHFALEQNYPNPFNPSTTISYSLPETGHVSLKIYNTLGEEVAVLVDGLLEAGIHKTRFDASRFASGIYFYRIEAGNFTASKKMLLLK